MIPACSCLCSKETELPDVRRVDQCDGVVGLRSSSDLTCLVALLPVGVLQVGDKLPKVTLFEGAPDKKVTSVIIKESVGDPDRYYWLHISTIRTVLVDAVSCIAGGAPGCVCRQEGHFGRSPGCLHAWYGLHFDKGNSCAHSANTCRAGCKLRKGVLITQQCACRVLEDAPPGLRQRLPEAEGCRRRGYRRDGR